MAGLRDYLDQLTESVVSPVWSRVMAASWVARAALLAIIVLAGSIAKYPAAAQGAYSEADVFSRLMLWGAKPLPVRHSLSDTVARNRARLVQTIQSDLLPAKLDNIRGTPWSAAQAVFGLGGEHIDMDTVVPFIRGNGSPRCGRACWAEIPNAPDAEPCIFISGWVLAALAQLGIAATPQELDFLLSHQNRHDGWWATFLGTSDSESLASTYSTAWAILGLAEQKRHGLIPADRVSAADQSITLGATWLAQHMSSPARWKNYPNLASGRESESVSGVALHALHVANVLATDNLDEQWLDRLPGRQVLASDGEDNYVELRTADRVYFDHFVQIKLPWLLIGTLDAFHGGNLWQQSRALHWMEGEMNDRSVATAYSVDDGWWRAELLRALNSALAASEPSRT